MEISATSVITVLIRISEKATGMFWRGIDNYSGVCPRGPRGGFFDRMEAIGLQVGGMKVTPERCCTADLLFSAAVFFTPPLLPALKEIYTVVLF